MAYLRNKVLFFTTSPRTPSKMLPEIRLLSENFTGRAWNRESQIEFVHFLTRSGFFQGGGSLNNLDFSARDRMNRAPKALGFVELSPRIQLTEAGRAFVYGKRPQEAFLRQLLKFQLPSPYHIEAGKAKGAFYIRPYLEIMRLVRDLGSLSFDEVKIFVLGLTDYREYDTVRKAVLAFRLEKEANKGRYKKFADEKWTQTLLSVYHDEIVSGKTKTRETRDISLNKFIATKKSNAHDYADACFRYLRHTGLVSISNRSRSIAFYPDRLDEVDFILGSVERKPVFIDDEEGYKRHLFDAALPLLYEDDIQNLIDSLAGFYGCQRRQLEGKGLDELKDMRSILASERKKAAIKAQIQKIKSGSLYPEIMDAFRLIAEDGFYDAPLMMEYNTWRAMTMLDGGEIKANLKFDDEGQPLATAAGNISDIECDYGDYALLVEVTLQSGQRQFESEGEPVARHFGQLKKRAGKETYCLFIAPVVNKASLAHFFGLNKIGISYYGGKTKIIPLELRQFAHLVEISYNQPVRPTPLDIRKFLDDAIHQEDLAVDENDWSRRIGICVAKWLAN